jgi:4'-phosphopantetheinyl transferase
VDGPSAAADPRWLDATEQARRERFRRPVDRDRFTVGVLLARAVLGAHLDLPPARVPLRRTCPHCGGPHGRPWVSGPDAPSFSVSHSGDLVTVAFLADAVVGVDVEELRPLREPGMARSVMSVAERAGYDRLEAGEQESAFYRCWVRKESILKATGDGLTVAMTDLTLAASAGRPRLVEWVGRPDLVAGIELVDLDAGSGYAASLAVVGNRPLVRDLDARLVLAPA